MKWKQILLTISISTVTTLGVILAHTAITKKNNTYAGQLNGFVPSNYKYAGLADNTTSGNLLDFTVPAKLASPTVVHIKTKTNAKQINNNLPKNQPSNPFSDIFGDDMMEQFFGGRRQGIIPEQKASGSGVIISDDGYIVTNNHVVENADEITVTLSNKKNYKAKVIGTDASYDLSVIKIEAAGLPFLLYGNSDELKIGQWVLAIGYPLNLETTVTAGIISAKARTLGLNKDKKGNINTGVESFIQTDAAVNMGNSGGALINTNGELIGINSAIASPTGYYSGYSYAIPVNIVKKVIDDLIKFGTVQRGFLGITFINASDLNEAEKKRLSIPTGLEGIYISDVFKDGGAYEAGIRKGDVLKKISDKEISSGGEIEGYISRLKPGDKIPVTYTRNGKENTTLVTLKNKAGNYEIVKTEETLEKLGADFSTMDSKKAKDYGVTGGVIVKKINEGALNDQTRMKDGFIILKINDKEIKSIDEMKAVVGKNKNITITGFYPGYDGIYEYPISLEEE